MRRHDRATDVEARDFARELRQQMTPSELKLWRTLRDRRQEFKFRRQYPIAGYTLDFFCPAASVCVEIDGDSHEGREVRDAIRDEVLAKHGIKTLRFASDSVYVDLGHILYVIAEACRDRCRESDFRVDKEDESKP